MISVKDSIQLKEALFLAEAKSGFSLARLKEMSNSADYDCHELLDYVRPHLTEIGKGSSRTVFAINSKYALKVANAEGKGHAQNNAEMDVFTNPDVKPIIAKIYDYDTSEMAWLVSELVRPLKGWDEFEAMSPGMGGLEEFEESYYTMFDLYDQFIDDPESVQERHHLLFNNPLFESLMHLMDVTSLEINDLLFPDHWGKTADGRVVILDYGFTSRVQRDWY